MEIFNAHKDRFIAKKDLHWGEELEYTLFCIDNDTQTLKLTNQAFDLIEEFNEKYENLTGIELHPEFGNWMVEAVPAHPYGSIEDIKDLLSCYNKIHQRYLSEFVFSGSFSNILSQYTSF